MAETKADPVKRWQSRQWQTAHMTGSLLTV
jgi:hypothetical protein